MIETVHLAEKWGGTYTVVANVNYSEGYSVLSLLRNGESVKSKRTHTTDMQKLNTEATSWIDGLQVL